MQHLFVVGGMEHCLWLSRAGEGYKLRLGDAEANVCLEDGNLWLDGDATLVHVARDGDRLWVHIDGNAHELHYLDPVYRYAAQSGGGARDSIRAPMPGMVVALSAEVGQLVEEGDILLVIESMKLETALRAPRDGIVEAVHLSLSQQFERDTLLVSLEPLDSKL